MNISMEELKEWANFYDQVFWVDDIPWVKERLVLIPLAMPHIMRDVDREKVKKALSASGALIARWTTEWDKDSSEWWYICCDQKDYDISLIGNPRGKRGIKKGLEHCEVRQASKDEFISQSYSIYAEALKSYGKEYPTKEEYVDQINKQSAIKGTEYWGAFVNNKMIAYSVCFVLNDAVSFGSTKSNPEFHKLCPNNAMFYVITKHYLVERGLKYVSNGSRTLVHTTTIHDFLIRMNFRKVYCKLNIELSPKAAWVYRSGIATWGKSLRLPLIMPKKWKMLTGFQELIKISKQPELK